MAINTFNIYIANVPFGEGTGSKLRPAVVVKINKDKTTIYKITSQYAAKSQRVKNVYYPIKEWQKAGLNKPSYIDLHSYYILKTDFITKKNPIGRLEASDVKGLFNYIAAHKAEITELYPIEQDLSRQF